MSAIEKIKKQVSENPVMLYMKGTPDMPMCGFSSRTVDALKKCEKEFAYCNVILDQEVRFSVMKHPRGLNLRSARRFLISKNIKINVFYPICFSPFVRNQSIRVCFVV